MSYKQQMAHFMTGPNAAGIWDVHRRTGRDSWVATLDPKGRARFMCDPTTADMEAVIYFANVVVERADIKHAEDGLKEALRYFLEVHGNPVPDILAVDINDTMRVTFVMKADQPEQGSRARVR